MSKAIALTHSLRAASVERVHEIASTAIVLACGAALIFAGQPLPL